MHPARKDEAGEWLILALQGHTKIQTQRVVGVKQSGRDIRLEPVTQDRITPVNQGQAVAGIDNLSFHTQQVRRDWVKLEIFNIAALYLHRGHGDTFGSQTN